MLKFDIIEEAEKALMFLLDSKIQFEEKYFKINIHSQSNFTRTQKE